MRRLPAIVIAAVVTALFAVFFLYPAGMVLRQAFQGPHGFTWDFIALVFQNPIYREGLWNALLLATASTAVALLVAMPLALISHRYDFIGKSTLGMLVLAPMILPPFVGAVGVKQILGVNGALNAALIDAGLMDSMQPFDWLANARFAGMVVMIALNLYPILYLNIAAALSNIDPAMEQAAANLGCPPWKTFFRITLPLAMPGVFAGASIVFIWAFTELGVPLVFDFPRTTAVQIFDGLKGLENNPVPYALTAVLLVAATAIFVLTKTMLGRMAGASGSRPSGRAVPRRLHGLASAACCGLFVMVLLLAILPHLGVFLLAVADRWYGSVLPESFTLAHFSQALGNSLVVPSIQNSLLYAGGATAVALAIGITAAWVIVRSDLRWRGWLDALVMLPLAVPGLVMAFGYLALSQPDQPFAFLMGAAGNPVWLLVIAYAIRRLPYVVRAAVAGLQQSNPMLEDAARSLGATPTRTLRRIALPLMAANLAAGGILAFAFAMLEVSDSLILAQQAPHFPITKAIYTLLSTLGNGTELAAALGVWALVFLATAVFGAVSLGGHRGLTLGTK